MGPLISWLIVAGIVGIIGFGFFLSRYLDKKRTEDFQKAANDLGLSFLPEGDELTRARLGNFELFHQGRNQALRNLISGETDEVRISIFDFRFTTGSGKQQRTNTYTVAAMESDQLKLPQFSLRPENIFDKVSGLLGFKDINFTQHPQFSNQFLLKGPDPEAIRAFFDPSLLDFFVSRGAILVEAQAGKLICHRAKTQKPEQLTALLDEAYKIFGAIVDRRPAK